MNDAVPQSETVAEEVKPSTTRKLSGIALKIIGAFFLLLAFCLLYYGVIAYVAWNSGEQIRITEIARVQQEEMANQFALAQADVMAGRYELALRRIDWLLERDSGYAGAADLQNEAQFQIGLALTPTVTPSPTLTATPTPAVTPTVMINTDEIDQQLAELSDDVLRGRWANAIDDLIEFQLNNPNYRRAETDRLLYDSYVGLGLTLLNNNSDDIELGLTYLNRARRLGDLTETVEGEVVFAELYLEGIVFYGVNWEAYLYYFRELCTYAPAFQDACTLLEEGLIAYGDQLAVAQDWCPAVEQYREARRVSSPADVTLIAKIEQADAACLLATPTPPAVISDTLPITNTVPTLP